MRIEINEGKIITWAIHLCNDPTTPHVHADYIVSTSVPEILTMPVNLYAV